jgi:hypothetical protein
VVKTLELAKVINQISYEKAYKNEQESHTSWNTDDTVVTWYSWGASTDNRVTFNSFGEEILEVVKSFEEADEIVQKHHAERMTTMMTESTDNSWETGDIPNASELSMLIIERANGRHEITTYNPSFDYDWRKISTPDGEMDPCEITQEERTRYGFTGRWKIFVPPIPKDIAQWKKLSIN